MDERESCRAHVGVSGGRLVLAVRRDGKTVLDPSPLGVMVDGVDLGDNVEIGTMETYTTDTTYPDPRGPGSLQDQCKGVKLSLRAKGSTSSWILDVRTYDGGVAWRYLVPGSGTRKVTGEATSFVLPGQGWYFNPVFHEKGRGAWPDNEWQFQGYDSKHSSDAITDLSLKWLRNRDKSTPFFLMHHFKAPHDNFENAERYDWLYADVDIPEPESLWKEPNHGSAATKGTGTSVGKRFAARNMGQHTFVDPDLSDTEYKRTAYQRFLKKYLRCVKGVDDNVGRLLDYLRQTGELDNTLVCYTSDQGFMLGEHDYIDKRWMYEESLRMPFIARYSKAFRAGATDDSIINNVDFAPTLLDFAGAPKPDFMPGRSFRPILEGRCHERV